MLLYEMKNNNMDDEMIIFVFYVSYRYSLKAMHMFEEQSP